MSTPALREMSARLILGPGDVAVAHQPDEYLDLATVAPTVSLLRGLIQRFCIAPAA